MYAQDIMYDDRGSAMFRKLLLFTGLLVFIAVLMMSSSNNFNVNKEKQRMKLGKKLTIVVSDDEVIDAEYLQKVLNGEIKKEVAWFDLWDANELEKLINYMDINDYMIEPGEYTFSQAWGFSDGYFVLNNGEKQEIFKFKKKFQNGD